MKALCIAIVLVFAGLAACKDDDFNDCAEVGDRGGRGLIPKCGDLPASLDGGGGLTQGPPPWDPDTTRPSEDDDDAAVDAGSVECRRASDCAAAPAGFGCESCQNGSEMCPQPACVDGECAISVTALCPENKAAFACKSDADCARGCIHQCEDGTSACLPTSCTDGVCAPMFSTCGHGGDNACPPGTAGFYVCTACGPSGGCGTLTLRCWERCNQVIECSDPTTGCDTALSVCVPSQFSGCI